MIHIEWAVNRLRHLGVLFIEVQSLDHHNVRPWLLLCGLGAEVGWLVLACR